MAIQENIRCAVYARVSTTNHGQDVTLQTSELREYSERRGWKIAGEFVDSGVSGSRDRRPELDALMELARARKVDVILTWKLDRWGRSLKHLVNSLAELEALGVAFVALKDNLDLSTPAGRLMFHVIGAMAEFERALTQERVKAGMHNARAKGRRIGRPPQTPTVVRIADGHSKRLCVWGNQPAGRSQEIWHFLGNRSKMRGGVSSVITSKAANG